MYVPRIAVVWAQYKGALIAVAATVLVIFLGWLLGLEGRLVAAIAFLVGLFASAFTGVTGLIALVPWVGPLILKALSIPFLWLMNGVGYFTAILLAQQGHGKAVVDSRILTYVLLIGMVLGYIIGKLI
jgi:hypothetical protein